MSSKLQVAIISGLSGAGRSTAAKCLEDLGWFVVDNLPPSLLTHVTDLGTAANERIAAVVDARSGAFFADLSGAVDELERCGIHPRIVFLEASDDVLVRRFENVRRPHPLQGEGRLVDGIERERKLLRDLRGNADLVIDTSLLNVHELRAKIDAAFGDPDDSRVHVSVVSFGYKHGLPGDADLVVDCRFLANPHWVPELRPLPGTDEAVRRYVLGQQGAREFLDQYTEVLRTVIEGYRREDKRYVTIAVGCTGGRHRSVVVSDEIAQRLHALDVDARVSHRDLDRA